MHLHLDPQPPHQRAGDRDEAAVAAVENCLDAMLDQLTRAGWRPDEISTAILTWAVTERTRSAVAENSPRLSGLLLELPDEVDDMIHRELLRLNGALPPVFGS